MKSTEANLSVFESARRESTTRSRCFLNAAAPFAATAPSNFLRADVGDPLPTVSQSVREEQVRMEEENLKACLGYAREKLSLESHGRMKVEQDL